MDTSDTLVGRKFKIVLRPDEESEHKNGIIRPHDGKVCKLTAHLRGPLYVTDIPVPEGTGNNDYAHNGFLLVLIDKDGTLRKR